MPIELKKETEVTLNVTMVNSGWKSEIIISK